MSLSRRDQERIAAALLRAERARRLRGKWAALEGLADAGESFSELRVAFPQRPLPRAVLVPMPEPRSPKREGMAIEDDSLRPRWKVAAHPGLPDLIPGAGAWWFRREKKREGAFYSSPKGRRKWEAAHREVELATGWPA